MANEARDEPSPTASRVHFGGPGSADFALRDLLAARIADAPPGSAIDVVTYYLRDRRLARDLAAARARGVDVRVTLEARPRRADANAAVAALLAAPEGDGGIGARFRALAHAPLVPGTRLRARLHAKLYVFSRPDAAFLGSFNPSGDAPELAPDVVAEIGDHDRGYNALVELRDPALVAALRDHARGVAAGAHGRLERCARAQRARVASGDTELAFWPRAARHPLLALLRALGRGDAARVVASHVSGRHGPGALARAARRGARVELLSHANERRFPRATEAALRAAGVAVARVGSEVARPMHDKFALVDRAGERCVAFGSFNLNAQSIWLNHEVGAVSRERGLVLAFEGRWRALRAAAGLQ
ncbi:MAG: phospholipase D-like domain-containing protein [Myxococcota bacterium]